MGMYVKIRTPERLERMIRRFKLEKYIGEEEKAALLYFNPDEIPLEKKHLIAVRKSLLMLFAGIKIRRKQKVAGNEAATKPSDSELMKSDENKTIKCKEKLVNNPKVSNETEKQPTSQQTVEETKTFDMTQLAKALQKSTTNVSKQEKLQPKLVEQRQQLNYVAQHIQNIASNIMKQTFDNFEETTKFNVDYNLENQFEKLKNEFRDIKAQAVSTLTSSVITLLENEGVLNENLCNHSSVIDLIEVKEICANHMRTLIRRSITDIGQTMHSDIDLLSAFQTNFAISFEMDILSTSETLTKCMEENAESHIYMQALKAFVYKALNKFEKYSENRLDDPVEVFETFETNYDFMFTEILIILNAQ